jgi:hypothetical protein
MNGAIKGVLLMDNQDLSHDYLPADEELLTLPHFDDESTLQSARPVVPLQEVKRASRVRRRILLGAALFVAAAIGAGAASLIYNQAWRGAPEASNLPTNEEIPTSADVIVPAGEAGGAIINSDEVVAIHSENAKPKDNDNEMASVPKPIRASAKVVHARKSTERVTRDSEMRARADDEAFALEEWRQQRRLERRLRRERRVEDRRGSDDTTRIREIFEGSPRP